MTVAEVRTNLARVRDEIASVQAAEGLHDDVVIVAVTKGHPADVVDVVRAAGVLDVGENRMQEALEKQDAVAPGLRWHLIGHLQTNKAKFVPGRFAIVHSVDSPRVVDALADAVATAEADPLPILVQVNVAGEEQKYGCAVDDVEAVVRRARAASGLVLRGLMTIAPYTDDERVQRATFRGLRELRDRLGGRAALPELSMGMSGDFRAAVAEGATMVRLGTVLFGLRGT